MTIAIGKIFETVPTFWKCKDGALSTHNGRGACNFHGGLSSAKAIKLRRRCKTIAVQTPTRQADLFRKEEDRDLFSPPNIFVGDFYKHKTLNSYARVNEIHKNISVCQFTITSQISKTKQGKFEVLEHSPCSNLNISFSNLEKNWTKIDKGEIPQPTRILLEAKKAQNTEGVKPTLKTVENLNTPSASQPQTQNSFVLDVPISQILTAENLFQNRKHSYSLRSVENIVQAVLDGSFRWANFDPIILWESPDKKLYVLSGHSRFEAFKRLSSMNQTVDGRTFATIPAKIERNITVDEAKEIALNSNTLSTKETDTERAEYYRMLRSNGAKRSEIEKIAQKNEGRNAAQIIAYSFLSPSGKALNALTLLDGASAASQGNAKILAKWIGEARQRYPILTDSHENELYDWLLSSDGYGRSKGQMSKETDFLQRLGNILQKRGAGGMFDGFDASQPLNIKNLQYKSPIERDYDEQLTTLKTEIADLEKELTEKRRDLSRRGGTVEEIERITAGMSATLSRKQRAYFDLLAAKGKMLEANKNQQSLFLNGLRGIKENRAPQYLRRL